MTDLENIPPELLSAITSAQGSDEAFPIAQEIINEQEIISEREKAAFQRLNKIGRIAKDGAIFAGISPDTNELMYIEASRSNSVRGYNFQEALKRAKNISLFLGAEYRLPTKNELNVIFNNAAVIGGFSHQNGKNMCYFYWSSTAGDKPQTSSAQSFNDGQQQDVEWYQRLSVCCIRTEPYPSPKGF